MPVKTIPDGYTSVAPYLFVDDGKAAIDFYTAPRRRNVVLAGATSGVLGTATSIGGPPMALVWQRNSGARLRGTMSGFFLVGSVMSIVALALTGAVDGHTVWGFAALVPAAVAGYLLSRRINRFLDPKRLRWLAIGASTLGAVVLIGRELLPI